MIPAGFIIDVPLTLSVTIRGVDERKAKEIARQFAESMIPPSGYAAAFAEFRHLPANILITEFGMESSLEEPCEILEEVSAEPERDLT